MRRTAAFTTALVAGLFLSAGPARATPVDHWFEEWGVGPRDGAMGNSYTAVSDDMGAVWYNPAGLSLTRGTVLTAGWRFVQPELWIHYDGGPRTDFNYPETTGGVFGLTTDLKFLSPTRGSFVDRLSLGFTISVSGYLKSFTTSPSLTEPAFWRYSDRFVGLFPFGLGGALRVTDWLSVGGSAFIAPSDTYTSVVALADIEIGPGGVTQEVSQGVTTRAFAKVTPILGVMIKPPFWGLQDKVRLGFSWRDKISSIDGEGVVQNFATIEIGGRRIRLPDPTIIQISALAGWSPQQITGGIAVMPVPGLTVTADLLWKQWSRWRNFNNFKPEPQFRDTVHVRSGLEYVMPTDVPFLHEVALRGGYYFEPTPTPRQDGPSNFLDNDKHVVSGGLGLRFFDPWGLSLEPIEISGYLQSHILVDRSTKNDRDPDYRRLEAGGYLLGGGVTIEAKF